MSDLEERFRALGRVGSPDLWTEIEVREPGPTPPGPSASRRWLAGSVAFAVAIAGLTFAAFVFRSGDQPRPASAVTNGKIAFSGYDGNSWQIYSVEPDGSGLAQLTQVSDMETATGPAWSPDGTRLAFVVQQSHADGTTGRSDLWVMNADGSDPRPLTDGPRSSWSPAWSPDGSRIAFARGDPASIYVVDSNGSDLTRLTPDDVNASDLSWSPDGSRIVFSPEGEVEKDLYVVNADGTGERALLQAPGYQTEPAWSPDGQKIAFTTSSPDGAGFGVSVMDADGTTVRSLTEQPAAQSAAWSPDGRQIVFMALRSGTDHDTLYVMNADGSEVQAISALPTEATFPSWQPIPVEATPSLTATPAPGVTPLGNGQIYFRVGGGDGPSWIESILQDGSERHIVFDRSSPVHYDRIAFSPDGSRIAFDNNLAGQYGIEIANPDGGDIVRLTDGVNDSWPSWSSDGTRVFFSSGRDDPSTRRCTSGADFTGPTDVYVMDADGSNVVRLTTDPAPEYAPIESPDGGRVAFVKVANDTGYTAIFTMEPDGTGVRQVSSANGGSDFSPSWSPDGSHLAFAAIRNEDWGIFVVNADGTGEHQIVGGSGGPYITDPAWSPDGSVIAYVRGTDHDNALFVMNADGSGSTELASAPSYGVAGDIAWQPQRVEGTGLTPTPSVAAPPVTPTIAPSFTPQIGTTAPVGPDGQTNAILYAAGSVWVTAYGVSGGGGVDQSMLFRVDPATSRVIDSIPLAGGPTWETGGGGLAFGDGSVWVVGAARGPQAILQRVDPQTDEVIATIPLGDEQIGADVSVDTSGVWVAIGLSGSSHAEVVRVDPSTNQIEARIALKADYVRHIVAADGGVLVEESEWYGNQGPCGFMTAIDPSSNTIITRVPVGTACSTSRLWVWNDQIWATVEGGFVRMDPRTAEPTGPTTPYPRVYGLRGFVASAGDLIWWSEYPGGNGVRPDDLASFDPVAGVVQEYDVQTVGIAGAASSDAIWVLNYDGSVTRIDLAPA
jgi:Tol biopolymer transport system component